MPGETIALPVAHHDGNYFADEATLDRLEGEGRVAFRYADACQRLAARYRRGAQRGRQRAGHDAAPRTGDRAGAWRHRRPGAVRKRGAARSSRPRRQARSRSRHVLPPAEQLQRVFGGHRPAEVDSPGSCCSPARGSSSASSASSTPSAVVVISRLSAIATTARMIARLSGLPCAAPWTKLRSTLMVEKRELAQVAERGIAGAEIVERDRAAQRHDLLERLARRCCASRRKMLSVTSTSSRCGGQPAVGQRAHDGGGEVGLEQLLARDVDRDLDMRSGQRTASRQASRSTHSPIGTIRRVSSASGMNLPGLTKPCSALFQRSSASKLTTCSVLASTTGWKLSVQFVACSMRAAQREFELAALLGIGVERRLVGAVLAAALVLGAVQREVGVAHQRLDRCRRRAGRSPSRRWRRCRACGCRPRRAATARR